MTRTPEARVSEVAALLESARGVLRTAPDEALAICTGAAREARTRRDAGGLAAARALAADALMYLSRPLGAARLLRRLAHEDRIHGDTEQLHRRRLQVAQALLHADQLTVVEDILRDVGGRLPEGVDSPAARLFHLTRAGLAFRRERPHEALGHYRRLARFPARPGPGAAIIEMNLANALSAAGRPRAAHRRFARARDGFVAAGRPELCTFADQNEAYAHLREGDLGHALELLDDALDAAERSANLTLFPALCLDRAELFLQLAMPAEARGEVERLDRRVPRLTELDSTHAAFVDGFASLLAGRHADAAMALADVASEHRQLGLFERAAHCELLEARARLEIRQLGAAADLVDEVRRTLTSPRDPRRVSAELLAADIACRGGDVAAAEDRLAAARAGAVRLPPWVQLDIARTEAAVAGLAGDRRRRRAALGRAADLLDAHIGRLPVDEYLIGFLGARSWLHEALAADLLADGEPEAAFSAVERGRARALVELLGAPVRLRATLGERRRERRRRELGIAELQLHQAATRADGVNPEQLSTRARRVAATRGRARPGGERRGAWRGAAAIRAALPPETTLVEFVWIADLLHAFVVARDGLRHVPLGVHRTEACRLVERLAFQFRTARTRPFADRQDAASRRALEHHLRCAADLLWSPLASEVPDGDVIVVPAEHLHVVPFHALFEGASGGEPSRWTMAYAPSATTYATPPPGPRARGDRCSVFALADAAAPEIDDEARAIAGVWEGTEVVAGPAARHDTFRRHVETSRIVHVATHGLFESAAPLFSSLRLADAWVNAYDVYGMRIGAELVVLAACDTARSVATRDADLLGLVRAFLVAGAGNVLAPQWPVSDAAARVFVVACFEALRDGAGVAAAARRAARATREQMPHPVDWAGWFPFCRVPVTGRGARATRDARRAR